MSDSTNAILRQAHELIEANQHEQAQELLAPLLETENDNPAFWWVYAHAVSDGAIGSAALDRVLQLDPAYPGARELKEDVLAAQALAAEEIEAQGSLAVGTDADADDLGIDDWEAIQPAIEEAATNTGTGRGFVLLIVALLVGASGLLLVLSGVIDINELTSMFGAATAEPVIVVSVYTAEPATAIAISTELATATIVPVQATPLVESSVTPTATDVIVTTVPETDTTREPTADASAAQLPEAQPEMVDEFIALVAGSVSGFNIDVSQSALRSTALGETVDVLVCATPGTQFNERLNGIMNSAVDHSLSIPTDIEAFAVSLVNCDDPNATVRSIGVTRDLIDAYAADEIDRKTFQQAWQPLS